MRTGPLAWRLTYCLSRRSGSRTGTAEKPGIHGTKSLKKRRTIFGGRRSGRRSRRNTPKCSKITRPKRPIKEKPHQTPPSTRPRAPAGQLRGAAVKPGSSPMLRPADVHFDV